MRRSHIAPVTLALTWLAVVVAVVTSSSPRLPWPLDPILLLIFAVVSCWAAWSFRTWFRFSIVSEALLLLPFAWAVMVLSAVTQQFAEAIIPLFREQHALVLTATVILARSLVKATLVSLIVVAPLVMVYRRYAGVVAMVLCIPVIALEWPRPTHITHTITYWLVGADLVFLVAALVGFAGLVSRRGMLANSQVIASSNAP